MLPISERYSYKETEAKGGLFINHLDALQKKLPLCFKDIDISKSEWV
jgi:hypothetical protein